MYCSERGHIVIVNAFHPKYLCYRHGKDELWCLDFLFCFRKTVFYELENGIEQKWENAIEKLTARKIRLHIFDLSLVSHFDQNQIDIRFSLLFSSYSFQIASCSRVSAAVHYAQCFAP